MIEEEADVTKDILLIKSNTFLRSETYKRLHDIFVEQLKSGVVIIPPYFDAEILNVPENVEVIVQSKDDKHPF